MMLCWLLKSMLERCHFGKRDITPTTGVLVYLMSFKKGGFQKDSLRLDYVFMAFSLVYPNFLSNGIDLSRVNKLLLLWWLNWFFYLDWNIRLNFSFGFWLHCRHITIAKEELFIDRYFSIKKFGSFAKKTNIGLRLMGHLDLWSNKRRPRIYF